MKLTTEQIDQIDTFLERNDVKYLDIKLELLDHIASQIEALMSDQNSSFEEAFTKITTHWKPRFRSSTSFLIGLFYSFPQIVLDRLLARMKKYHLFIFCFSVFIYIPMFYYYPDRWCIWIKATEKNDEGEYDTAKYYTTEEVYEECDIGDMFSYEEDRDYKEEPVEKKRIRNEKG